MAGGLAPWDTFVCSRLAQEARCRCSSQSSTLPPFWLLLQALLWAALSHHQCDVAARDTEALGVGTWFTEQTFFTNFSPSSKAQEHHQHVHSAASVCLASGRLSIKAFLNVSV